MDIIIGKRQTGKTTELIKRSAQTGAYIAVHSQREADRIHAEAQKMNLHIPLPITYDELISHQYGEELREALIDNAEMFLRFVANTPIGSITLNIDSGDTLIIRYEV